MKWIAWLMAISIGAIVISTTLKMCSDGAKTIEKQYSPSALLKKYEYFKDLSAAIDKKRADIEMYKEQIREEIDHVEKLQLKSELRGIISIHNQLCADYNSAMAKFNYRFTNKGDLPATNLEPLPREIKPYIASLN